MEIAEVNFALHDVGAGLIGGAMHMSRFDTAACHPKGEGTVLVSGLIFVLPGS